MGFGNNSAANAAANQQAQQQQQIGAATNAINAAYSSPARQQQYSDYYNALQNQYTTQVNNAEQINARGLKFANARSGLTGGSEAVDSNTQLQKDYTNGLLQASQQAQSGEAALENSDINAKNQLIGLAEQGDYTGSLGTQIAQAQNANLTGAQSYANTNALGNLFAGTSAIYNNEQTAAANRLAQKTPFGSPYGGNTSGGSAFQG
jgi:hypothetical protein